MRKKYLFPFLILPLLTSCSFSGLVSNIKSHLPFGTTTQITNTNSSNTSVSTTEPIDLDITDIKVNFTAINDFHGVIEGRNSREVGIAKMASYLKGRKAKGDILLSSGDNYQGSVICGLDHGEFLSKTFKDIGFDAYTLGNHEFDWELDDIFKNEEYLGDKFLGANIFNYPNINEKSNIGQKYKITTLYPGTKFEVKVGIIGVIGEDQFSSITSTHVQDIIFKDPTQIVKNLSQELRYQEKCDIVVASYHAPEADESIASLDNNGHHYVDAVFLGHDHYEKKYTVNDVPFIEGGSFGMCTSNVSLSFNKQTGSVSTDSYEVTFLPYQNLKADSYTQQELNKVKEKYSYAYELVGNNTTGAEISTENMSRYYAKLSYEKATALCLDVKLVMFNYAREELVEGNFTYSQLYETHPFGNKLYILSVTGSDIKNELRYNYGYAPNGTSFNNSERYNVLVYDYNGFHQTITSSYSKSYNYFPSAFTSDALFEPFLITENDKNVNVFELALNSLKTNPNITTSDFSGTYFF